MLHNADNELTEDIPRSIPMKKALIPVVIVVVSALTMYPLVGAQYKSNIIDTIKLSSDDIPGGFTYGNLPPAVKTVLKDNPWKFDRAAITRLSSEIYPGADQTKIADIHMSIFARTATPFGDDIVCYIIVFNDTSAAKGELVKLNEYVGYNSDRAIIITRENIAIFLHVDDVKDFPLLRDMAAKMEDRINKSPM
jgi:hypothetical protein